MKKTRRRHDDRVSRGCACTNEASTNAKQAKPTKQATQTTDVDQSRFDRLNDHCLRLFDIWCERRSVIPLAYLLHGWPMPKPDDCVSRLVNSLRELLNWHADKLSADEEQLIELIVGAAGDEYCSSAGLSNNHLM